MLKFFFFITLILDDLKNFQAKKCFYGYNGDNCDECGKSFYEPDLLKIVGGTNAISYSWPSMAYILFTYKADVYIDKYDITQTLTFSYYCGGSLIDRRTVLTAAHCLPIKVPFTYNGDGYYVNVRANKYYPSYTSMFNVYLGLQDQTDIYKNKVVYPTVIYGVGSVKRHEAFDSFNLLNDIGLIRLKNEVTLNNFIQIACLPSYSPSYPDNGTDLDAYAIGWGKSFTNSKYAPELLNNVKLTIYNSSMCKNTGINVTKNWASQICAGDLNGNKSICYGDSGGPLFYKTSLYNKTKYVLVGITSYTSINGCNVPEIPNVFTRVSFYINWINKAKFGKADNIKSNILLIVLSNLFCLYIFKQ